RVLCPAGEERLSWGILAPEIDREGPIVPVAEKQAEVAAGIDEVLGLPGIGEVRDGRSRHDGVESTQVVPLLPFELAPRAAAGEELPEELLRFGCEREQGPTPRNEGSDREREDQRRDDVGTRVRRREQHGRQRTRRGQYERHGTRVPESVQQH